MHRFLSAAVIFTSFSLLPLLVFAVNDVLINDVTRIEIVTADTAAATTLQIGSGGQASNFTIGTNYVDITIDGFSNTAFVNSVTGQFLKVTKLSGSNDYQVSPSCPMSGATITGNGAQVILRLEIVTTNSCTTPPPSGGGGGGGGGGGSSSNTSNGTGSINLSGRAYPGREVTILKDAQVAITTIADAQANFRVSVANLSAGNYFFSAYSEDAKGLRSSLLTFPVTISSGAATNINNIFIAPTIGVDKTEVKKGDTLVIFGQTVASSQVTIQVNSDEPHFATTNADASGVYLYNFDTSLLEFGDHSTKSKSASANEISTYSPAVAFKVGTQNLLAELPKVSATKGDSNNDGRVNLIDYSIVAYWYKRPNPPKTADLNGDDKVDLVDFSILAYNWTG